MLPADTGAWHEPMSQNRLQLIQITDTHFCADPDWLIRGVNPRNTLACVLESARTDLQNTDLILATGDLSEDGSDASYQELNRIFGKLAIPVMPLPGNHDLPERLTACLDADNMIHQGYRILGNWQIITLDSARPDHIGGRLAPVQLHHLQQRLQAEPERHTLVALHHPPVEIGSRWMDEIMLASAHELFNILDQQRQVRAVIWGHIHQEYSSIRNNVMLLGTPSSCIQFKPAQDAFALDTTRPAYRRLRLYPDGKLDTEVIYADWNSG